MAGAHYSLLMSVHAEPGLAGAELARHLTPADTAQLTTLLAQIADAVRVT